MVGGSQAHGTLIYFRAQAVGEVGLHGGGVLRGAGPLGAAVPVRAVGRRRARAARLPQRARLHQGAPADALGGDDARRPGRYLLHSRSASALRVGTATPALINITIWRLCDPAVFKTCWGRRTLFLSNLFHLFWY